MDPDKIPFAGFRLPLRDALLRQDVDGWRQLLAVFGDWLEDHDNPERFVARASWEIVGKPPRSVASTAPYLFRLRAYSLLQTLPRLRKDACNEDWLLGFAPGSLRLKRSDNIWAMLPPWPLDFTWVPSRTPWKYMAGDGGRMVLLFAPPDPEPYRPLPLFPGL